MNKIGFLFCALLTVSSSLVYRAHAADPADAPTSALNKLPAGYRDWKVISVAHEAGDNNDIRAILGNDLAIKAYRENKLPLPDGAMIARLAWRYEASEENNKVFGREQSWVAGQPSNVQFMVKDSKKYVASGGWGFAQLKDGKPDEKAKLGICFPCHVPAKDRDYLFTRYAP